jgi:uncharacterized SAM-binding protein YcdF (DUF218 family)
MYRSRGFSRVLPRSNSRMLYFLRKLVEALLLPIGFSGLLIIAGVVLRRRWIAVAGFFTLYLFSSEAFSRLMIQPLERVYKPATVAAAPNADAIVVLNGAILRGVAPPGLQWGESANRFFAAVDLARAGKAKLFVISAGMSPRAGDILRRAAICDGIPAERIVLTPRVLTTEDEARAISQIPGIRSILLVSSAFHLPRAVLLFRARGLDVIPFPTDERALPALFTAAQLFPGAGALRDSELALREYYGLAAYRTILFFRPAALGR